MKQYYTVYKITNKLDGRVYIGKHKTDNLDDSYMGSGLRIQRAINKYGPENFEKEILYVFPTKEEMDEKEAELVNESFVERDDTYNLKIGGTGGWGYINKNKLNIGWTFVKENNLNNSKNQCYIVGQKIKESDEYRKWFSERVKGGMRASDFILGSVWIGKKHSEETKQKMRESHKGKHEGSKNSQYGKVWIYNLEEKKSIRVPKEQLNEWLDKGWIRGRKMNFKLDST